MGRTWTLADPELSRIIAPRTRSEEQGSGKNARSTGKAWTLDDPKLQKVVKGMVGTLCYPLFTSQDREDVFQETLRRLTEKGDLPEGKKREFCSSFLYSTVHNVVRETWRTVVEPRQREVPFETEVDGSEVQERSEVSHSEPNPWHGPPSVKGGPLEAMMAQELLRAARGCLRQLHRTRRRPVFLKLLGFKTPEIAQRLGWTLKSVEGRVLRGMKQLRSCLAATGVEP